MHVVDSRLSSPQTAWGLQCVVYLEVRFGESPSQSAQSLVLPRWFLRGPIVETRHARWATRAKQLALCPSLAERADDRVNSTSGIPNEHH